MVPPILNLGTKWDKGASRTGPITPGDEVPVCVEMKSGMDPEAVCVFSARQISLPLSRKESRFFEILSRSFACWQSYLGGFLLRLVA